MNTGPIFEPLQRLLDLTAERQRLISSNLANIDTPRYQAQDIDFEASLAEALNQDQGFELNRTDPRHFAGGSGGAQTQIVPAGGPPRRDGNNVNLDREMARMAETALLFQAGSAITQAKLHTLRNVITGGR
jgi:flagellar basal-body rod protein FlgB